VAGELQIVRASLLRTPVLCWSRTGPPEVLRVIEAELARLGNGPETAEDNGAVRVEINTEMHSGQRLDAVLDQAGAGDTVDALFGTLSDKQVVAKLCAAAERGASLRLLLNSNAGPELDARAGLPNGVVAAQLEAFGRDNELKVRVRWMETGGGRSDIAVVRVHDDGGAREILYLGSADCSRRDLRGYNLATCVLLDGASRQGKNFGRLFEQLWDNTDDKTVYSSDFAAHRLSGLALGARKCRLGAARLTGTSRY